MIRTGRTSERMARVQYTLVCLDRMAKFSTEHCREWVAQDVANRLGIVSSDIASLVQFTEGLVNRVQLLQDAASGIINIDQNEVMKVLTIASVVGIPPVLVVGVYGMNFKYMPEYDWHLGLSLCAGDGGDYRVVAADLVQMEGLDLNVARRLRCSAHFRRAFVRGDP